jgi:hypothetical protein
LNVEIPKIIKIGGFDYSVVISPERDKILKYNHNWGECSEEERLISIRSDYLSQQMSETFIHEILHAINDVYLGHKLEEDEGYGLGNGLFQVFEQLGIRFVRENI